MVKSVGNNIIIDGVNINDGDYVFGDTDSTVFIHKELLTETLLIAKKMLVEEDRIKNLIERGTSVKKMLESVKSF